MNYASTLSALSPTSWWKLDETNGTAIADAQGVNGATISAGATLGAKALIGDPGTAITFDGATSNSEIVTGSGVVTDTAFSFCVWFKTTGTGTQSILSQQDGTGTGRTFLYLEDGALKTFFGNTENTGSSGVNDGEIHFVVVTYNATTLKVYLDCVEDISSDESGEGATGPLVFGNHKSTTLFPFSGSLDDIAFWQGTTLTAQNVIDLHAAGYPLLDPEDLKPGLVVDSNTLKPGLVNSSYTGGAGTATTLKPSLVTADNTLKPGLIDDAGNLKQSLTGY